MTAARDSTGPSPRGGRGGPDPAPKAPKLTLTPRPVKGSDFIVLSAFDGIGAAPWSPAARSWRWHGRSTRRASRWLRSACHGSSNGETS